MQNFMTAQQVFDTVREHLLSMDGPALGPDTNDCAYRGENGSRCAIGRLIDDEHYCADMEGATIDDPYPDRDEDPDAEPVGVELVWDALYASGVDVSRDLDLLTELQRAHDADHLSRNASSAQWKAHVRRELGRIAHEYKLKIPR